MLRDRAGYRVGNGYVFSTLVQLVDFYRTTSLGIHFSAVDTPLLTSPTLLPSFAFDTTVGTAPLERLSLPLSAGTSHAPSGGPGAGAMGSVAGAVGSGVAAASSLVVRGYAQADRDAKRGSTTTPLAPVPPVDMLCALDRLTGMRPGSGIVPFTSLDPLCLLDQTTGMCPPMAIAPVHGPSQHALFESSRALQRTSTTPMLPVSEDWPHGRFGTADLTVAQRMDASESGGRATAACPVVPASIASLPSSLEWTAGIYAQQAVHANEQPTMHGLVVLTSGAGSHASGAESTTPLSIGGMELSDCDGHVGPSA